MPDPLVATPGPHIVASIDGESDITLNHQGAVGGDFIEGPPLTAIDPGDQLWFNATTGEWQDTDPNTD